MKPYMRDEELEFFSKELKKLKSDAAIVEWGSGGSTIMILDQLRPKQRFYSVEHSQEWATKVSTMIESHPKRDQLLYILTGLATMEAFVEGKRVTDEVYELHKREMIGRFLEENPSYVANYIDPTELHADFADILDSDFFLVDGLARGAVLATLRVKAKKGAKILLHDYVGREYQYAWALRLFDEPKIVGTFAMLTI